MLWNCGGSVRHDYGPLSPVLVRSRTDSSFGQRHHPRMRDMLSARAIERAALIKGGYEQLALSLGVSVGILRSWRAENAPMPGDVFLKIVDILIDDDVDQLKGARPTASPGETV